MGCLVAGSYALDNLQGEAAANQTIHCNACPPGANCNRMGVTFDTLEAINGWWSAANGSGTFYRCRETQNCPGGPPGTCAGNRAGVLCALCR